MKREVMAFHEAGHVIAAHYQKLRIGSVSIVKDENTLGRAETFKFSRAFLEAIESSTSLDMEPRHKDRLEKECRSLLAGMVAQRRFAPRSIRAGQTRFGRHGDLPQVEDLLERITVSALEWRAYIKLLKIQTENLIERRWRYVEAVAAALIARQMLSREDIWTIIRETTEAIREESLKGR